MKRLTPFLLVGLMATCCGRPGPRPNLVLITFDGARSDHVSAYGYGRATTPHLDRLARAGAVFDHAYSQSDWTLASLGSLLTGREPARHHAVTPLRSLAPELPTLAELLAESGYETAAFGVSLFHDPQYGLGRGFKTYEAPDPAATDATALDAKVVRWLSENARRPFFLWVHYPHPHAPYRRRQPWYSRFHPGRYTGKYDFSSSAEPNTVIAPNVPLPLDAMAHLVASYDSEIAFTDEAIQKVLDVLDLTATIVAVTSDHGEELKEHGQVGHGLNLNREVIQVPLVVAGPGIGAGLRIRAPVSHVDLMPTLLELAGVPFPGGLPGESLVGALRGGPMAVRPVFSEQMESSDVLSVYSLVYYPMHLIIQYGRKERTQKGIVLFDLERDAGEQRSIFEEREPRHVALRGKLEAYVASMGGPEVPESAAVPADKERIRRLRQPGYLKAW